jgi:amidohydrolase
MRRLALPVAVLLVAWPLAAQLPAPLRRPDVVATLAALEPKVIAWRRDIHQHPELGNRKTRTAAMVAGHLKALGIEVQTGVAHTGVVGLLRGGKPGPVVLLRADMDALPVTERNDLPFKSTVRTVYNGVETGVMHACGHDTHVAILMGVAELLAGMRGEIPGTVKFVFQPAEEGPPPGEQGGAELMVKEGVLDGPKVDAAFALHIWSQGALGHVYYTPNGMWAGVDDMRILVKGRQTHGAYPWDGADPVVASAHIITALQTIVSREQKLTDRPAVITIGKISGGTRSNIIPEQVELIGTLRSFSVEDRARIHASVHRIAGNVAEALRVEVEVQIPHTASYPVTVNDPALTAQMVPVLEAVTGPGKTILDPPNTGAEDFAFFAERVPGFYIQLGGRPSHLSEAEAAPHHTPDFVIDDSGLGVGVRAMAAMALQYLATHPASR